MSKRVELTVPDELWERVELARGDVSRAVWIKRAIEARLVPGVRYDEPASRKREGVWTQAEVAESFDASAPVRHEDTEIGRAMSKVDGIPVLRRGSEVVYKCPYKGCIFAAVSPGVCVHHRTEKLVKS